MDVPFLPLASNTIERLSGDHRGVPALPIAVNCNALLPSRSLTQISIVPERSDIYASFLPSGEICGPGPWSVSLVEGIRMCCSLPATDKSICQILRLLVIRWYASRYPLRDTAGYQPLSLICTGESLTSAETLHSPG